MLDLVFHNGRVLTQAQPACAEAVGVRDGRIVCVGRNDDVLHAADATTRRIDLGGRTLVPGFNDAHAHIWKIGQLITSLLDARRIGSLDELVARLRAFATPLPADAWVQGRGYNEASLRERRAPTRWDLDRAEPNRPVVLTRTCGHICAVNSPALARAGIGAHTTVPTGGVIERDQRGEPTGILHETAIGLVKQVMPAPTPREFAGMIEAALGHQLTLGITASAD